MSSPASKSGPMREARSCYDHLAGRLGVAVARAALTRGWVVETGTDWRLADGAAEQVSRALGVDVRLDTASRRPDVRPCLDGTEHRPHLAGKLGAAILDALLGGGWVERVPGGRALAITPLGAKRLSRTGISGVVVDDDGCDAGNLCYAGAVSVTAAGAEDWGALVERAAGEGWTGVAALAGCDRSVSDAVAGNVSAYGQQVADTIWSVRTWDRVEGRQRTFAMVECEFRTGGSRFSAEDGRRRYDVIEVTFLFRAGTITAPLRDADLVGLLGVAPGDRVPLPRVREAVLAAG